MPASPTRHRVALAIALVGMAVSVLALVVHRRIAADPGYTSFCNLGEFVNCDAVLGSRYGMVLGVSVAAWSLVAFAAGAALALPGTLGAAAGLADLGLLGLVSGSLGFALVLGGAMIGVLRHLCLLCLALDAVIAAWAVAVAPLASRFEAGPRVGWWRRRGAAWAITAGGAVLAVAGGTWGAVRGPGAATTIADVRARDPKFYTWYTRLPVHPVSELTPPAGRMRGRPGAAIEIVEFSDFQCPFCVRASRDLHDLVRARPEVSLVFRYFPLDTTCNGHLSRSLHPDACLAAYAAECAGQQGRFWEYHDLLFENHEHLERDNLFRFARELHLDVPAFRTCLDDPATRARIGEDVEAGARASVSSTPTIFINGRTVEGALDRTYYDYAIIIEQQARDAHTPRGAS